MNKTLKCTFTKIRKRKTKTNKTSKKVQTSDCGGIVNWGGKLTSCTLQFVWKLNKFVRGLLMVTT